MLTDNRMPWDSTAADADGRTAPPAVDIWPGRRLIAVMLLTAAALDLTRCGLVMAAAQHPAPTAGLAAAGLATAPGRAAGTRHRKPLYQGQGNHAVTLSAAAPAQAQVRADLDTSAAAPGSRSATGRWMPCPARPGSYESPDSLSEPSPPLGSSAGPPPPVPTAASTSPGPCPFP